MSEQTVTGRPDEDIILPCSFESGPKVIIHGRNPYMFTHTTKTVTVCKSKIPDTQTVHALRQ